jgi:uncharacterized protein YdeI (YjbR/CyaY-like superfamily)
MAGAKGTPERPTLRARSRAIWRRWLETHHARDNEIWLIYQKKHTGAPSVAYAEAVEEAICFGWIDTTVRRIDEDTWMQRFTPRRPGSAWSIVNRARYARLLAAGQMTPAGMAKAPTDQTSVPTASWLLPDVVPPRLARELKRDKAAWARFTSLPPSHRKRYIVWIESAKQDATRERRVRQAIEKLKGKEVLGM